MTAGAVRSGVAPRRVISPAVFMSRLRGTAVYEAIILTCRQLIGKREPESGYQAAGRVPAVRRIRTSRRNPIELLTLKAG